MQVSYQRSRDGDSHNEAMLLGVERSGVEKRMLRQQLGQPTKRVCQDDDPVPEGL